MLIQGWVCSRLRLDAKRSNIVQALGLRPTVRWNRSRKALSLRRAEAAACATETAPDVVRARSRNACTRGSQTGGGRRNDLAMTSNIASGCPTPESAETKLSPHARSTWAISNTRPATSAGSTSSKGLTAHGCNSAMAKIAGPTTGSRPSVHRVLQPHSATRGKVRQRPTGPPRHCPQWPRLTTRDVHGIGRRRYVAPRGHCGNSALREPQRPRAPAA
jgi:hypothetical protein